MKVLVTVQQRVFYENELVLDIDRNIYNRYKRTGELPIHLKNDLIMEVSNDITDGEHVATEEYLLAIESQKDIERDKPNAYRIPIKWIDDLFKGVNWKDRVKVRG